jgi:hypothetical protein
MNAKLAQLARIAGLEGFHFFNGQVVILHRRVEIQRRSLAKSVIHFHIEKKAA